MFTVGSQQVVHVFHVPLPLHAVHCCPCSEPLVQRWVHLHWLGLYQPRQRWARDTPLFKAEQEDGLQVGVVGRVRGEGKRKRQGGEAEGKGGDWKRMNRHLPIGSKQVQYSSFTLHLHSVTIVSCVCFCPSVHSGPSAGFEAFFTGVDILVVAIVTKKNYITVKIPDCNLSTGWVSVCVRVDCTYMLT